MLIEVYEKVRREELENLVRMSRLRDEDAEKVREVVKRLRKRSWW